MTTKQLAQKGFKYIVTKKNGLQVWAGFTGYKDNIQYYYVKNEEIFGDVMATTLNDINMFQLMCEALLVQKNINNMEL